MAGKIDASELPPELRRQLGLKGPSRSRSMTIHEVRTYAIRVLNVMADLTQTERERVLRHASKANKV